jgi:hypothetical protein
MFGGWHGRSCHGAPINWAPTRCAIAVAIGQGAGRSYCGDSFFRAVNNYIPSFHGAGTAIAREQPWDCVWPSRLQSRPPCWICGRQVDRRDDVLIALLLARLRFRYTAPGCPRQCEELRINSEVILARFYYLECRHYCARHIDHRCCVCRAQKNPQTPRPPQAVNSK